MNLIELQIHFQEQFKSECNNLVLTLALSTLSEGIFLTDKSSSAVYFFRLDESQTAFEYCPVPDKFNFEKSSKTQLTNPEKSI